MPNTTVNFFDDRKDAAPIISLLAYSNGTPYFRLSLGGLQGLTIFISPDRLSELHAEIGMALLAYEAAKETAVEAGA